MAISSGDLNLAEELLNAQTDHDAEWNFLKGAICYSPGLAGRGAAVLPDRRY